VTTQNPNLETLVSESEATLESFTDELIEETSSHLEVIETVISSLEQNDTAMVSHTDKGYLWKFQYGTVEVYVQLTGENDDDLFKVWAYVLNLPVRDELGLMRKLLTMNWAETLETCFGIIDERVVVLTQRIVADLSPSEISRAITLVATIADENDEAFIRDFASAE
jgi:Putative bacterial sensory transduction regulator